MSAVTRASEALPLGYTTVFLGGLLLAAVVIIMASNTKQTQNAVGANVEG